MIAYLKKLFLLILISIGICFPGFSQDEGDQFEDFFSDVLMLSVIPPSPSVSGVQGFFEVPVSYYSGRYNISIPVWSVQSNIASFDISLDYATNGVRVDEIASVVGNGWVLNAGGSISRVIRGTPDEDNIKGAWKFLSENGFKSLYSSEAELYDDVNNFEYNNAPQGFASWLLYMFESVFQADGGGVVSGENYLPVYDFELDLYSYSFNGYSGKFFVLPPGDNGIIKVINLDDNGLEFECFIQNGLDYKTRIIGFIAYDGLGRVYEFGNVNGNKNAIEEIEVFSQSINYEQFQVPGIYNTAWHLAKITKHGFPNDSIKFTYKSIKEITKSYNESLVIYNFHSIINNSRSITYSNYSTKKIEKIFYNNELEIVFIYNEGREDYLPVSNINNGAKLIEIKINSNKDRNDNSYPIRKLILNSSYYITNVQEDINELQPYHKKRLFLNSVEIRGGNYVGQASEPMIYTFFYNSPEKLPSTISRARDIWGYYNGQICRCKTCIVGNINLLPEIRIGNETLNKGGADRNVHTQYLSYGTLKQMYYPTGGYAVFQYEPQKYYDEQSDKEDYGPGVRIKRTQYHGIDKKKEKEYLFSYHSIVNGSLKSSGRIHKEAIPKLYKFQNFHSKHIDCGLLGGNLLSENPVNETSSIRGIGFGYIEVTKKESSIEQSNKSFGKEVNKYHHNHDVSYAFIAQSYLTGLYTNYQNRCLHTSSNVELIDLYAPLIERSNLSGITKETVFYEGKTESELRQVKKIEYSYDVVEGDTFIPYIKPHLHFYHASSCITSIEYGVSGCGEYAFGTVFYTALPARNFTRKTQEKTTDYFYDNTGGTKTITTISEFEYKANNPLKPSKIYTKTDGQNEERVEYIQYCESNVFSHIPNGLTVYPDFIDRKRSGTKNSSSYFLQNGIIIEYNEKYQPVNIIRELSGYADSFDFSYNFETIPFMQLEYYENSNKLKVQTRVFDDNSQTHSSYVYDSRGLFPIAKIDNLHIDNLPQTALSEINKLNGFKNLTLTNINTINSINANIRSLMPEEAAITTYTHFPYVGMTSASDPRGDVVFYEYDKLQKLRTIRDRDRNILQAYVYNYAENVVRTNEEEGEGSETNEDNNFDRSATALSVIVEFDFYLEWADYNIRLLSECNRETFIEKSITSSGTSTGVAHFTYADFETIPSEAFGWFKIEIYKEDNNNIDSCLITSPINEALYFNPNLSSQQLEITVEVGSCN
jgi:hypothetical protein